MQLTGSLRWQESKSELAEQRRFDLSRNFNELLAAEGHRPKRERRIKIPGAEPNLDPQPPASFLRRRELKIYSKTIYSGGKGILEDARYKMYCDIGEVIVEMIISVDFWVWLNWSIYTVIKMLRSIKKTHPLAPSIGSPSNTYLGKSSMKRNQGSWNRQTSQYLAWRSRM